ncbi:response regulator [candidate division KSB1 bacterium]|nr:response regulator [candidate division KSB1 bacterium]
MKKYKLLLIDDNVDMLLIGKRIFGRANYDFYTARNGQEGLETAKFHKPDIIILDFILPDINGMQFIKILSTSQQYSSIRNIPIIILTAKAEEIENFEECYKMGLRAFLNKPFGHRELVNVVDNIVRLSKLEHQSPQNGTPAPKLNHFGERLAESEWVEDLKIANSTIVSLCKQLYDNEMSNLTEQQKMDVHAIYNSSKRMTKLINERKISAGPIVDNSFSI